MSSSLNEFTPPKSPGKAVGIAPAAPGWVWRFWNAAGPAHQRCAECSAALEVLGLPPGSRVRCGRCGVVFLLPGKSAEPDARNKLTPANAVHKDAGTPQWTDSTQTTSSSNSTSSTGSRIDSLKAGDSSTAELPAVKEAAPPKKAGPYLLEQELARGGTAVVYRARHETLGRPAAVKLLRPDFGGSAEMARRLTREALALARFSHPRIVPVLDAGVTAPPHAQPFLIMELVEGEDLARRLAREGALPWRKALELLAQVLEGVDFAHAHGVIHRDLKPANVLLDTDDQARLVDFGLARDELRESREAVSQMTRTGVALGTPAYMPPEQARGERARVERRSDLYSLGAILYEMLTGRPPFQGATVMDILYRVIHEEPVAPRDVVPGLPKEVAQLCLKALEKDPANRYASAHQMLQDVRAALAGESLPVAGTRRMPILSAPWVWWVKHWRRNRFAATMGLGVFLLCGVLLLLFAGAESAQHERAKLAVQVAGKGKALLYTGRLDEADEHFIEAQRLDPENESAYLGRRKIRLERERVAQEKNRRDENLQQVARALSTLDPEQLKSALKGGASQAMDALEQVLKDMELNTSLAGMAGLGAEPNHATNPETGLITIKLSSGSGKQLQASLYAQADQRLIWEGALPTTVALAPGLYLLKWKQAEMNEFKSRWLPVGPGSPALLELP